jgi:hypothetical protein
MKRYPGLRSIMTIFATHGTVTEQYTMPNANVRDAAMLVRSLLEQPGVTQQVEAMASQYQIIDRPTPDAKGTVQ